MKVGGHRSQVCGNLAEAIRLRTRVRRRLQAPDRRAKRLQGLVVEVASQAHPLRLRRGDRCPLLAFAEDGLVDRAGQGTPRAQVDDGRHSGHDCHCGPRPAGDEPERDRQPTGDAEPEEIEHDRSLGVAKAGTDCSEVENERDYGERQHERCHESDRVRGIEETRDREPCNQPRPCDREAADRDGATGPGAPWAPGEQPASGKARVRRPPMLLAIGSPPKVSAITPAAPARLATADPSRRILSVARAARSDATRATAASGTSPRRVAVMLAAVTWCSPDASRATSTQSSAVVPVEMLATA